MMIISITRGISVLSGILSTFTLEKMINHFAMERMREILASKDDLSKEMIEKMGMEEMISYLEEDYKKLESSINERTIDLEKTVVRMGKEL